jgi:crotonobetainyl-CoA:carnitine CoA-transferase CaiB-like acyl-CoA transferase
MVDEQRSAFDAAEPEGPVEGPLAGVRVLDLSRALAGPYATLMLADAGAQVIKVEQPGTGDDTRGWGPPFTGEGADRESVYFLSVNRTKRSITLDLKDAGDVARLRALVAEADVLVENFRPGVLDRLGLGVSELMAAHPRLVVLSITGFGAGGPDGHRPGFDQIIQGEAGLMSITGLPDGPPLRHGLSITDILAGMFGAYGVVAALHERERSGRGQIVTTSLLAAAIAVHAHQGTRWTIAGEVPGRSGNHHGLLAPYGAFPCSDGWINIAVGSPGLWARFAPLVGIDAADPDFVTNADRMRNRDRLTAAVETATRTDTIDAWLARLDEAGVPAGRIRTMDEVYTWDHVRELGMVDRVEHPVLGPLDLPGAPLRWSRSGRRTPEPPPTLGGDQALLDVLGPVVPGDAARAGDA